MCVVCPTVTAKNTHDYRAEMERVQDFAKRLHIDLMDEEFTGVRSVTLTQAWWPHDVEIDLHIMYKIPELHLPVILDMKPDRVIFHAESDGNNVQFIKNLQKAGIKAGVAFLQDTFIQPYKELVELADHALIFSGNLGHHGGVTDLSLLKKVPELLSINPNLEIAWDGGISQDNIESLKNGGIQVYNVGGSIQHGKDPEAIYAHLVKLINE